MFSLQRSGQQFGQEVLQIKVTNLKMYLKCYFIFCLESFSDYPRKYFIVHTAIFNITQEAQLWYIESWQYFHMSCEKLSEGLCVLSRRSSLRLAREFRSMRAFWDQKHKVFSQKIRLIISPSSVYTLFLDKIAIPHWNGIYGHGVPWNC